MHSGWFFCRRKQEVFIQIWILWPALSWDHWTLDMVRKIWIEKYSELLYCCPFVNGFVCGLCMYSDSVFSTHNVRLEVQAHSFSAVKGISALSHFGTVLICYILGFLHSDPGEMAKRKKQKAKRLLHFLLHQTFTLSQCDKTT